MQSLHRDLRLQNIKDVDSPRQLVRLISKLLRINPMEITNVTLNRRVRHKENQLPKTKRTKRILRYSYPQRKASVRCL